MKYNISGNFKVKVDFDIDANSEEEARVLGLEILNDYYHLDVIGAYHDRNNDVNRNIHVTEHEKN